MTLSQALTILGRMKEDNHVEPELFDVFVREKVYLDYANEFLAPEQIDDVDLSAIPGYVYQWADPELRLLVTVMETGEPGLESPLHAAE